MINIQQDSTRGPLFRLTEADGILSCPFCGTSKLGRGVLPNGISLNNDGHDYWMECSCGARVLGEARTLSYEADTQSDLVYEIHIAVARSALARWNKAQRRGES